MTQPRYFLPDHPVLTEVYSKTDLRAMLHSGELSRSDIVLDDETGLAHLLGDLLAAPHPEVTAPPVRSTTGHAPLPPLKHEFRADTPLTPSRPAEPDFEDEEDWEEEETGDEDDGEAIDDGPMAGQEEAREPTTPAGVMLPSRGGEEILYLGHPSWFAYPKSLLSAMVLITMATLAHHHQYGLEWVVLLASVATLVLVFVSLDRTTTTYFITTRRVEIEYGLVGRNSKEVRIADIRAIDVHQRAYAAFVGIGSVDFDSAAGAGAEIHFKDVRRPHEIKQLVRQLQG